MNAATLLDFTCSFETSFYWQGLLPRYSTSNSKHFLCLILLLCARTHTHTQCLSVSSRKGVPVAYTRNFLTPCSTSPIVFPDLVFICLGKTNSYNSYNIVTCDKSSAYSAIATYPVPPLSLRHHFIFLLTLGFSDIIKGQL